MIVTGWRKAKLADCVELLAGFAFKSEHFTVGPNGISLVKGENVGQGRILWDIAKRWPESDWEKLEKFHLAPGDVIVAMDRPWVPAGLKWAFIRKDDPKALLVQRCARLRASNGSLDQNFLRFIIGGSSFENYVKPITTGVNVPHISGQQILGFEFALPPLSVQRRIAGILTAYDDLIKNNLKRVKILEQMARSLYREWFVYYRFPGHEKVKLTDSPLGKIPQGWEVKKLSEFVNTKYGYTESTNGEPVGPQYLRGMDINKTSYIDWSEVPYCPITPEDHVAYRLKLGDVVVIRMADPGKIGIVEQEVDAVFASYLIRVAPKDNRLSPYFLFYLMESKEYYGYITGASTGTTRKSASAGVIADYPFVLAPQKLVTQFEKRVTEIRSLLTILLKQTVNLRRTRDLLLPRLLSGQVNLVEN